MLTIGSCQEGSSYKFAIFFFLETKCILKEGMARNRFE